MGEERIVFKNDKNQNLVGYYHKENSDTLMVLCHGLEPFNATPGLIELFYEYHNIGVSVLRFDATGYGESGGEKRLDLEQRIQDIGSILEGIGKDYKKIILYAPSFAAIIAVLAALRYKRISKIITVNGLFNFNDLRLTTKLQIKLYLLKNKNYKQQLEYYKEHFKPELLKIPVLVISSDKDELINPKQSLDFFNNLQTEKKRLRILGGDHAMLDKKYIYQHFDEFKSWILS